MNTLVILGSTGSIGVQSLDVARTHQYPVVGLAAARNIQLLEQQVREFKPKYVAVLDQNAALQLQSRLSDLEGIVFFSGPKAAETLVQEAQAHMVLNAIVGIAGLSSTLAALNKGTHVALANKESLVAGGALVMQAAQKNHAHLLPVDSEHSAIFQCLQDPHSAKAVRKIILTASGGPFFGKSKDELQSVTKEQALKHPNWDMGAKITIDSATLMNKGLEFMEAMWLFSVPPSQIEIVVQRESVIHSMVEFEDHSILAQLGSPDMRLPIQYALTWPQRTNCPATPLDFKKISSLTFGQPDPETFRCLQACIKAAEKGGLAGCAANGANEEAVALFLQDKIGFLDIGRLVEACVDADSYAGSYDVQDVYQCDRQARAFVHAHL